MKLLNSFVMAVVAVSSVSAYASPTPTQDCKNAIDGYTGSLNEVQPSLSNHEKKAVMHRVRSEISLEAAQLPDWTATKSSALASRSGLPKVQETWATVKAKCQGENDVKAVWTALNK